MKGNMRLFLDDLLNCYTNTVLGLHNTTAAIFFPFQEKHAKILSSFILSFDLETMNKHDKGNV